MNDIAKEMRDLANEPIVTGPEGRALLRKGAGEIERMQFELKAARNEIEIADGEIERLRAAAPPS